MTIALLVHCVDYGEPSQHFVSFLSTLFVYFLLPILVSAVSLLQLRPKVWLDLWLRAVEQVLSYYAFAVTVFADQRLRLTASLTYCFFASVTFLQRLVWLLLLLHGRETFVLVRLSQPGAAKTAVLASGTGGRCR